MPDAIDLSSHYPRTHGEASIRSAVRFRRKALTETFLGNFGRSKVASRSVLDQSVTISDPTWTETRSGIISLVESRPDQTLVEEGDLGELQRGLYNRIAEGTPDAHAANHSWRNIDRIARKPNRPARDTEQIRLLLGITARIKGFDESDGSHPMWETYLHLADILLMGGDNPWFAAPAFQELGKLIYFANGSGITVQEMGGMVERLERELAACVPSTLRIPSGTR